MRKNFLIALCCCLGLFFPLFRVTAVEPESMVALRIDTPTLLKGYTVVSPDEVLRVGIFPEVLAEETALTLKQYAAAEFDFPENHLPLSNVYEFDLANKSAFKNERPLRLQLKTATASYQTKKMFFWNGVLSRWVELPSETVDEKTVKAGLHLPYAKVVILAENDTMSIGKASWYKYKNCDCAASPDYPKGSILKVKNLNNGRELFVTVNDFGPDRSIFPERVIDLDKVAFEKLGPLGAGVLQRVAVSLWRLP